MILRRFKVSGNSMEPALKHGQQVIGEKLTYYFRNPKCGDLAVVRHPNKNILIIKRITGITGEKYFVEGDNKNASDDSRQFSFISRKNILYRVIQ